MMVQRLPEALEERDILRELKAVTTGYMGSASRSCCWRVAKAIKQTPQPLAAVDPVIGTSTAGCT
ncbi:hypothetical protein ACNKHS_14635 [Shigella flexneri]